MECNLQVNLYNIVFVTVDSCTVQQLFSGWQRLLSLRYRQYTHTGKHRCVCPWEEVPTHTCKGRRYTCISSLVIELCSQTGTKCWNNPHNDGISFFFPFYYCEPFQLSQVAACFHHGIIFDKEVYVCLWRCLCVFDGVILVCEAAMSASARGPCVSVWEKSVNARGLLMSGMGAMLVATRRRGALLGDVCAWDKAIYIRDGTMSVYGRRSCVSVRGLCVRLYLQSSFLYQEEIHWSWLTYGNNHNTTIHHKRVRFPYNMDKC